jgi:thioredoxin-related protein
MNKIINELKSEYKNIDFEDYDYDFDDIEKFNVGKILPVFIFYKDDKEITRLCGEHKKEEFIKIIEGEL